MGVDAPCGSGSGVGKVDSSGSRVCVGVVVETVSAPLVSTGLVVGSFTKVDVPCNQGDGVDVLVGRACVAVAVGEGATLRDTSIKGADAAGAGGTKERVNAVMSAKTRTTAHLVWFIGSSRLAVCLQTRLGHSREPYSRA